MRLKIVFKSEHAAVEIGMTTPSSETHPIGLHGMFQSAKVAHTANSFQGIHAVCQGTPCSLAFHDVSDALNVPERRLLVQNGPDPLTARILMTKSADSLFFHDIAGRLFSALRAKSMYLPPGSNIPPYEVLSHVAVPGQAPPKPIYLSMGNEVCPVDTISRFSPFDHISKQFHCMRMLDDTPRVIFSSNDFGSLHGALLGGKQAKLLKESFLGLHQHFVQSAEGGILNRKLTLVPEISDCLMLRNREGDVSLQRCADGIVGTRERKQDGGHTVIFVVKSDDIHRSAPSANGVVQVFKMDYAKKKNKGPKRRISFVQHPRDLHALAPEFVEQGHVHAGMTVQDILNHFEHAFRHEELGSIGCEQFHQYIQLLEEYERHLKQSVDD
jgi:hypothetical protein